jgi:hypothetical protein
MSILHDATTVLQACEAVRRNCDATLPEMPAERLAKWVLARSESIQLATAMAPEWARTCDAVPPEVTE